MKKEEILIFDENDLSYEGKKLWEENLPIDFHHLKFENYQKMIRENIVLLKKKDGSMIVLKSRYLLLL
jgi:hypothetical protein